MFKRENLIPLLSAIVLVVAFVILSVLVFFRSALLPEPKKTTIEPNRPPESVVSYEKGTSGRLYEKLTEERKLNEQDLAVRKQIISSLQGRSGTLLSSPKVVLGYLATPDFFQAEIVSSDVLSAKQEVVNWFLSKGISKEGICELPIMFFLGAGPAEEYIKSRQEFSPLAPSC